MAEKTLLMIKPDAVRKKVIGAILSMLEDAGFEITGIQMKRFSEEEARRFYIVHKERPFYPDLVRFITSAPVVGVRIEGEGVIERLREFIGATDPAKARPGSIRALYGSNIQENAVHASDSPESARYELPFFFPEEAPGSGPV